MNEPEVEIGTSNWAVASLFFGIVPCLAGLLGIVFGLIAFADIRAKGTKGTRMATTGIILGIGWLLVGAVGLVLFVVQRS